MARSRSRLLWRNLITARITTDGGERERLCHLRAGLDGEAAHVLCDLDQAATSEDLIAMLRRRFGNQDQRERFRAELKAIVRRDGASLQSIYSEVRRIMALAFPGERGGLWEILARDTFLSALRDEPLRQRVMERDPQTLDDTLRIAYHLEAIVRPAAEPSFDDLGRRRVKATHDREPEDAERRATERRLQHLETAVDQYRAELDRCRAENDELRRPPPPPTGPVYPPPSYRPDMATFFAHEPVSAPSANYGPTSPPFPAPPLTTAYATPTRFDAGRRRAPAGVCFGCGLPGHRVRVCPGRSKSSGISRDGRASETYLDIDVHGTRCHCLLDTGSEVSLVPRKYIPLLYSLPRACHSSQPMGRRSHFWGACDWPSLYKVFL